MAKPTMPKGKMPMMTKGKMTMPPEMMPATGKPAVTGKANPLAKMPPQAKAYGVRGTKPPTKGGKK